MEGFIAGFIAVPALLMILLDIALACWLLYILLFPHLRFERPFSRLKLYSRALSFDRHFPSKTPIHWPFLLSILRHECVPSRSVLGRQHNRTVLTQNGSRSIKINVCAKTEPPVEHAPQGPASLDFSFPNFRVPRTVFSTLSRRPLHPHSLEHPLLP